MKQENEKQGTAATRIVEDPANPIDQVSAFSGFFVRLSVLSPLQKDYQVLFHSYTDSHLLDKSECSGMAHQATMCLK